MARSPLTPTVCRNSWSIRAVGSVDRNRAKRRHAACSGSCRTSRLSECVEVSTANKCVRHNCAALKACRRPPVKQRGQILAMKSSGA